MNKRVKRRFPSLFAGLCLLVIAAAAIQTLVMAQTSGIAVRKTSETSITIAWNAVQGVSTYRISYQGEHDSSEQFTGSTGGTTFTVGGLRPNTRYDIYVDYDLPGYYQVTARTRRTGTNAEIAPIPTLMPMQVTCPFLPDTVKITGHVDLTQCQMVDSVGVGRMDLIKRGVISAVDLWYYVPENVEVCLLGDGWLVLLDADYMPRMDMELQHYHRDGWTCGTIDREGTVVLLASPPADSSLPHATPPEEPLDFTLPVVESIPLADCHIKLVETLFLRAEPGGEIIDIVWQNSEVHASEIYGYWYKVEFEGLTGYISRYHRKVLHGNCG